MDAIQHDSAKPLVASTSSSSSMVQCQPSQRLVCLPLPCPHVAFSFDEKERTCFRLTYAPLMLLLGCEGIDCYSYDGDLDQVNSMYKNLLQVMMDKGPFDGLMGFSEGGGVVSSLLVQDARRGQPCQQFKCGIFFNAAMPVDPAIVQTGERREMNMSTDGVVINVPTAHIWSPTGDVNPGMGADLVHLCDKNVREEFIHHLGHEVPGSMSSECFTGTLRVIERTIERAKM